MSASKTVTHILEDSSGTPLPGVYTEILLISGDSGAFDGNGSQILSRIVFRTGADGSWSQDLIPNSDISPEGTYYQVNHKPQGSPNQSSTFTVTSGGTARLFDLLITPPESVSPSPRLAGTGLDLHSLTQESPVILELRDANGDLVATIDHRNYTLNIFYPVDPNESGILDYANLIFDNGAGRTATLSNNTTQLDLNDSGGGRFRVRNLGTGADAYLYNENNNLIILNCSSTDNSISVDANSGQTSAIFALNCTNNKRVQITGDGNVGFYGATPVAQQTVTGSKGGNAALASLISALANLGFIVDTTT